MHDAFHVSMLRKYVHYPNHILNFEDLDIQDDISLEDKLIIQIMDRREQVLRVVVIMLLEVIWTHYGIEEAM